MSSEIALLLVMSAIAVGVAGWLFLADWLARDDHDDYDDPNGWGV